MHIYFLGQKGFSGDSLQNSAELRVEALAKQALKQGHKVTIAATNRHSDASVMEIPGVQVSFFPSLDPRIPGGYLYAALSSLAALVIRPDTIVVQNWKAAILLHPLLAFLPHTCAVWTIESLPIFPFQRVLKYVLPRIASGFDEVCVTSRTVQYRLITMYGMKTTYIPDGYTVPRLADTRLASVGLTSGKYVVALAQDKKEIQRIVRAFAAAKTRKKLVVFGTGRSSAKVTYIAAPLSSRLASSIVRQAGVVLGTNPLYTPLLLQAMDAGRQIIATTDSLHEELLGVTAQYYSPNDAKQLTALIKHAFASPSINRAAMLRAKHHFTWNTVGKEYERVYKHSKAVAVPFDSIGIRPKLSASIR